MKAINPVPAKHAKLEPGAQGPHESDMVDTLPEVLKGRGDA